MSDFINYSADSKYYNQSNALAVGKIKDEMEGVVIGEFVGSKPKLYSVIQRNFEDCKKVKGVNKIFVAIISHG